MNGRLWERHRQIIVIVGAMLIPAVILVALSLQRPAPPTFAPSPVSPEPVGEERVGPRIHTVATADSRRWVFFSFSMGSVIENPGPTDWDLAFRRFQIIANGGEGFAGTGGLQDLGPAPFDSIDRLPTEGYELTVARTDSVNAAIQDWYDYSFFSHLLTPKPRVYAVRTADGRFAKIELLGYYCPGATPGCMTFRYVYQGDGSNRVGAPPAPLATDPSNEFQ